MRLLIWYLAAVNALAFAVYWVDKRRAARGERRIRERELLFWAAAGGSLGAFLAMRTFRHKTRKASFRLAFLGIVLAQVAAVVLLLRR